MRNLSLLILSFGFLASLTAQSPHGANLKIDCAACHSAKGWEISASYWQSFDPEQPTISKTTGMVWGLDTVRFHHGKTSFALTGQHKNVDCRSCHETLQFSETPTDCNACHKDMHQLSVGTDCARCHTTANWLVDNIPELHQQNGFPLTGVHQAVSCEQCHTAASSLLFTPMGNDCISCHRQDYQASTNPNHQQAGFSTDCQQCHNVFTPGWGTDKINHDFFPLTGGHDISDCNKCHPGGNFANTPTSCNACHQADFSQTTNPNHTALGIPTDCATCHTTAPGWEPATFPIHNNYYALNGTHAVIANDCATCHHGNYNSTPNTCNACHAPDYAQTTNPSHSTQQFSTDCATCHSETAWAPTTFDHNTVWPITGAHIPIASDCNACHHGDYNNTPNTCNGCHAPDYAQTTNPNHAQQQFSTDCTTCHSSNAWAPTTFDHNTVWPITGAHIPIASDCNACHHGNYSNTPNTCNGCHTPDFNAATNPNHTALNLPTDCAMCHTMAPGWQPATFPIHNNYYALNGAHASIANDCATCHNGNYINTPNTCNGCHAPDYAQTTSPNHAQQQFSTDCTTCHSESAWKPATFDHDAQYFPIYSGKHNGEWTSCSDCHTNPSNYAEFTCTSCHVNPETNNSHNGINGYVYNSTACLACHPTGNATDGFDHNTTNFPLMGAHQTVNCLECHANGYAGTPTQCSACHTPDFNATTNPNHTALNCPTDCATCHTTAPGWEPATFPNHNNYYVIKGAHTAIANDCAACHHGNYNNTPNTCNGCHAPDYAQTTNPNHAQQQFSTDCTTCHTDNAWAPSTFNHNTVWPLTGAHIPIASDCNACHHGNYNNTPNTCNGCHAPDYNTSTNPSHTALNLPTDCAMCHTTAPNWQPATFPIHNNFYPLNGAHAAIANNCNACHNGNYNNTPNTCFGCHAADYNGATNPKHASAGFPTACQTCHTETAWDPSTFNHDQQYFPIYSGKHKNEWNQCVECHTVPGNFNTFSCIACHEHNNQSQMAQKHQGVNGYQYVSTACLNCHPNGN